MPVKIVQLTPAKNTTARTTSIVNTPETTKGTTMAMTKKTTTKTLPETEMTTTKQYHIFRVLDSASPASFHDVLLDDANGRRQHAQGHVMMVRSDGHNECKDVNED